MPAANGYFCCCYALLSLASPSFSSPKATSNSNPNSTAFPRKPCSSSAKPYTRPPARSVPTQAQITRPLPATSKLPKNPLHPQAKPHSPPTGKKANPHSSPANSPKMNPSPYLCNNAGSPTRQSTTSSPPPANSSISAKADPATPGPQKSPPTAQSHAFATKPAPKTSS